MRLNVFLLLICHFLRSLMIFCNKLASPCLGSSCSAQDGVVGALQHLLLVGGPDVEVISAADSTTSAFTSTIVLLQFWDGVIVVFWTIKFIVWAIFIVCLVYWFIHSTGICSSYSKPKFEQQ